MVKMQKCSCCQLEAIAATMVQCPFCQQLFCQDDPTCLADHLCKGAGQSSPHEDPDRRVLNPEQDAQANLARRLEQPVPPPPQLVARTSQSVAAMSVPALLSGGSPMPAKKGVQLRATNGSQTRLFPTMHAAAGGLGTTTAALRCRMSRGQDYGGWTFAWVDANGQVLASARTSRKSRWVAEAKAAQAPVVPPPAASSTLQKISVSSVPSVVTAEPPTIANILGGLAQLAGAGGAGVQLEDLQISIESGGTKATVTIKTLSLIAREPA